MKGVILAGGFGSRMYPFTKSVTNKHLAPVYTKDGAVPMIDYPIKTLQSLGVDKILIITSQEHCGDIVEHLGDGYDRGVEFTYKIQEMRDPNRPSGIASALKLCKDFTGDDKFFVILGDNYFEYDEGYKLAVDELLKNGNTESIVFVKQTDEWERFGVAVTEDYADGKSRIKEIIEKPNVFVSDLAVTGLYLYSRNVYNIAETLKPSERGELEITDINNHYIEAERMGLVKIPDEIFWSDMGTPESMIKTQEHLNE